MSSENDFFDDGTVDASIDGLQDGFAAIMLAASASDGHIANEEMSCLTTLLCRMNLYSDLSPSQFGSMMDRLLSELDRNGVEKLVSKAVAAIPPELFETAYVNAVDVVLADRVVEEAEKRFIDRLRDLFGIDTQRSDLIFQVMTTKNQG